MDLGHWVRGLWWRGFRVLLSKGGLRVKAFGFGFSGVWGLGFRVWGLGFRVQGSGARLAGFWKLEFRGLGCGVWDEKRDWSGRAFSLQARLLTQRVHEPK